jgi:TonB family protein
MAPVSKDTLEITSPGAGSPVSQSSAPTSNSASPSRSEVVSLEIPVKVHGSRVTQVVGGVTPSTEPFEEQTQTMIVFPGGAVVKMSTAVNAGQMLVLTNLNTRQDAICRVLKVRPNPNLANYVEMEFTHRQPGYWGISFPSDAGAEPKKVVGPPASAPAETKPSAAAPSDISWAPAPPAPSAAPPKSAQAAPLPPVVKPAAAAPPSKSSRPTAPKAEPAFISIGTQEEVQVAASATAVTKPGKMPESEIEKFVAPAPKNEPAIAPPPAAAPAEVSLTELQGDAEAATPVLFAASSAAPAEPEVAPATPQATAAGSGRIFGRFAGSTALDSTSAAQPEDSTAHLDLSGATAASRIPGSGQNWTLIAAGIAVLVAGLAGGIYYVRSHARSSGADMRVASVARPTAPVGTQSQGFDAAVQPSSPVSPVSNAPAASATSSITVVGATAVTVPAKVGSAAPLAQPQPAQIAPALAPKAVSPSVTSNMMTSALNAHPTAAARAGDEPADEPNVTARPGYAESNGNALAEIPSSSTAASLPMPTIQPEGPPTKAGGHVQEPKLISSAMPVYPQAARNSGIQGDVVVETTIDKDGNVAGMRVISGPAMLRQSALDALRKWKYEPSKLDGQPIGVQVMVTIKFRK